MKDYGKISPLFEADVFQRIRLEESVFNKESSGGTGKKSLARQIKLAKEKMEEGESFIGR